MLASNLVLADHAPTNRTFVAVSSVDGSTVRIDNSTSAITPRKMKISHGSASYTNKGMKFGLDRRLVGFSLSKADTDGLIHTGSFNTVLQVPQLSLFTEGEIQHLVAFAKNFFSDANLTSILLGEA